jgi:hypothetical protein
MPFRQVIDGPEGQRYVVTADRVATRRGALAGLLTGASFLPDVPDDEWEVRVEAPGSPRTKVFAASSGEVAERLMVLLGEEIELGLLEV